jgi:hypothetical protein
MTYGIRNPGPGLGKGQTNVFIIIVMFWLTHEQLLVHWQPLHKFEVAFSFLSWWYHGKNILHLYIYVKVGVVITQRSEKLEI